MTAAWLFCPDARPEVGGGHVARCLTLASACRARGMAVSFWVDAQGDQARAKITEAGFALASGGYESGGRFIGCVLDGYKFDEVDFTEAKRKCGRLVTIVDHQAISPLADLVVAPGQLRDHSASNVLAGFDYALIDPAFVGRHTKMNETVGRILVSFGLRDSHNATGLVLKALGRVIDQEGIAFQVDVAIGGSAPHLGEVRDLAQRMPYVRLRVDHRDMPGLVAEADLSIGAGGVGLLECLAAGVPSIAIVTADNQVAQVAACVHLGATPPCDPVWAIDADTIAACVTDLCKNFSRRQDMAARGRKAVDGRGAERVSVAMDALGHDMAAAPLTAHRV